MAKRSGRGFLYFFARLLGDFSAVSKGRSMRRVKRRLIGKAAGRSIMRWIFILGLLIPVYHPGKPLLPVYYIDATSEGYVRIYSVKDLIVPRFIIKDGRVYDPARPLLPVFRLPESLIEGGQ